jgi:hypothetical protein
MSQFDWQGPREIAFCHVWELLRTDLSESSLLVRSLPLCIFSGTDLLPETNILCYNTRWQGLSRGLGPLRSISPLNLDAWTITLPHNTSNFLPKTFLCSLSKAWWMDEYNLKRLLKRSLYLHFLFSSLFFTTKEITYSFQSSSYIAIFFGNHSITHFHTTKSTQKSLTHYELMKQQQQLSNKIISYTHMYTQWHTLHFVHITYANLRSNSNNS